LASKNLQWFLNSSWLFFHHFPILPLDRTSPGECEERAQCGIAVDACVQRKDLEVLMALQVRFHCASNR
jgi:hypothetical protein